MHAIGMEESRVKVRGIFAEVRAIYIREFVNVIMRGNVHVEPALRSADGTVTIEGKWRLPYRPDYIDRSTGKSGLVHAPASPSFPTISAAYGNCKVEVSPFSWDHAIVAVRGVSQEVMKEVTTKWFLRWFDSDERNPVTSEGLYGVVHFLDEPPDDSRTQFAVDLGSAAVEAIDELLLGLATAGATNISVT
jgi:hypothetical protein